MGAENIFMHIIVMSTSFKQTTLDGPQILSILKFLQSEEAFVEINRHVPEPKETIDSSALLCKSLEGKLHRAVRQGLGGIDDLNDYDQEMLLSFAIDNFLV
ncbi:Uncharacterized protein Fot_34307 [Forsythia ovata]|uniref:Uncharacterized protein n=1 Tax=Forsythia ovata TaxID=205694 RepID=A0ABD1SJS1_9LAMI